jgi:hypothetical protein
MKIGVIHDSIPDETLASSIKEASNCWKSTMSAGAHRLTRITEEQQEST